MPRADRRGGALLMLIGIHNAWDIAVWNSIRTETEGSKEKTAASPS
jgi:hypothetical protein